LQNPGATPNVWGSVCGAADLSHARKMRRDTQRFLAGRISPDSKGVKQTVATITANHPTLCAVGSTARQALCTVTVQIKTTGTVIKVNQNEAVTPAREVSVAANAQVEANHPTCRT
jgi:hypothetical protein